MSTVTQLFGEGADTIAPQAKGDTPRDRFLNAVYLGVQRLLAVRNTAVLDKESQKEIGSEITGEGSDSGTIARFLPTGVLVSLVKSDGTLVHYNKPARASYWIPIVNFGDDYEVISHVYTSEEGTRVVRSFYELSEVSALAGGESPSQVFVRAGGAMA